ncbi:hypothetical protein [Hansschlegelia zhihuaiae]|uniref:Uncharacterized protein n=1 Tax=Hansschlegelia zhihuaiae TaxID=405005 RepID=A0A4Q0MKE9_9HYPH|nr:hypothetical protein [Hansschlegelia zhihuaiae]RXF73559.1 hypothetical protein EK403_10235 [Hansschlegelia zhihuaiae]
MNPAPLSFRAVTALIVAAYAVLLGVLVAALGHDLLRPVPGLAPQVSWLMHETTQIRVSALLASGRSGSASLYALSAALSWGLIGALCAGGFVWGVLNKGATVLGVDKSMGYLTALAGLYALSTVVELGLHHLPVQPRGFLHAIPALWFAAMIPSAAILARVGALIAHDFGALIVIALEGEPKRIAELVASAEETRGVTSMEARLARRIAAMRAPR